MIEQPERTFPLKEYLGFTIERSEGAATASLRIDERHLNPFGVVHGTVPFTLMDTAMGAAVVSVIGEGKQCATIELHTRFHAPATSGVLRAEVIVLSAGKRVVHLQARTVNEDGRLVASATASFAVFDARS